MINACRISSNLVNERSLISLKTLYKSVSSFAPFCKTLHHTSATEKRGVHFIVPSRHTSHCSGEPFTVINGGWGISGGLTRGLLVECKSGPKKNLVIGVLQEQVFKGQKPPSLVLVGCENRTLLGTQVIDIRFAWKAGKGRAYEVKDARLLSHDHALVFARLCEETRLPVDLIHQQLCALIYEELGSQRLREPFTLNFAYEKLFIESETLLAQSDPSTLALLRALRGKILLRDVRSDPLLLGHYIAYRVLESSNLFMRSDRKVLHLGEVAVQFSELKWAPQHFAAIQPFTSKPSLVKDNHGRIQLRTVKAQSSLQLRRKHDRRSKSNDKQPIDEGHPEQLSRNIEILTSIGHRDLRQFMKYPALFPVYGKDCDLLRPFLIPEHLRIKVAALDASRYASTDFDSAIRTDISSIPVLRIAENPSVNRQIPFGTPTSPSSADLGFSVVRMEEDDSRWVMIHAPDPTRSISLHSPPDQVAQTFWEDVVLPEGRLPMFPHNLELHDVFKLSSSVADNYALTFAVRLNENGSVHDFAIFPAKIGRCISLTPGEIGSILLKKNNDIQRKNLLDLRPTLVELERIATHWRKYKYSINPSRFLRTDVRATTSLFRGSKKLTSSTVSSRGINRVSAAVIKQELGSMADELATTFAMKHRLPAISWHPQKGYLINQLASGTVRACAPMQRYPDMIAHQQIKGVLRGTQPPLTINTLQHILQTGVKVTTQNAELTYRSRRYWVLEHLKQQNTNAIVKGHLPPKYLARIECIDADLSAVIKLEDYDVTVKGLVLGARDTNIGAMVNLSVKSIDPTSFAAIFQLDGMARAQTEEAPMFLQV